MSFIITFDIKSFILRIYSDCIVTLNCSYCLVGVSSDIEAMKGSEGQIDETILLSIRHRKPPSVLRHIDFPRLLSSCTYIGK